MFFKMGRLINQYNINITFHNYKIKCTQNKTGLSHSKWLATLNYKIMIT